MNSTRVQPDAPAWSPQPCWPWITSALRAARPKTAARPTIHFSLVIHASRLIMRSVEGRQVVLTALRYGIQTRGPAGVRPAARLKDASVTPLSRSRLVHAAFYPLDVAIGGALDRSRPLAADDSVPPTSVNAVEPVGADGRRDPFDGRCREWNFIGIAPHEADEATVGDDGHRVAGEEGTAALRSGGPVEDGTALKMPAALDQREAAERREGLSPIADRRVGPHDPSPVCLGNEDGRVAEGLTPFHADAIEMRMRHRDAGQPTPTFDRGDGRVVDKTQAVPEDIAGGGLHQQRSLADPNRWLGPDPGQSGFQLADVGTSALRLQLLKRRPTLSLRRYVLAFVLTDRAVRRRFRAGGMLHAAGPADVGGHASNLESSSCGYDAVDIG